MMFRDQQPVPPSAVSHVRPRLHSAERDISICATVARFASRRRVYKKEGSRVVPATAGYRGARPRVK